MRERVAELGGEVDIRNADQGTMVEVTVPVSTSQDEIRFPRPGAARSGAPSAQPRSA
jgi:signal transduction histidine kinase